MKVALASLLFSIALISASYCFNRWLSGNTLKVDPYRLALTSAAVLLLAILAEAAINPLFEIWRGEKLWEYHVLPLHDRNVSALALLVWTAYGAHLYFMQQSLEVKLPERWNNRFGKALIFGLEAPLLFEVAGNLTFLQVSNTYYAYYLPGDLFHLTSLQVVPVYILCIFIGLVILEELENLPQRSALPVALFAAGIGFLLAG